MGSKFSRDLVESINFELNLKFVSIFRAQFLTQQSNKKNPNFKFKHEVNWEYKNVLPVLSISFNKIIWLRIELRISGIQAI